MLRLITEHPEVYQELDKKGKALAEGIRQQIADLQIDGFVNQIGSMFTLFFTKTAVKNFSDAKTSDTSKFGIYFREMLNQGVYLPPSQFESWFLSAALDESHIEHILKASKIALEKTRKA